MDRISELPECIVHHILFSFDISPTELVRMSILSKNWFNLIASFPNLDFNLDYFRCRESFFKYVEYTTSRFCHKNAITCKFKLITTLEEPAELDIVNRSVELVCKNGVRDLTINITDYSELSQKYRLPDILLSVSVLKSLTIKNCKLPSSLMVNAVKLKSLIRLTLKNVSIDDEVIKYLTTSCPLLQVIKINMCYGFKKICINRHQNLQTVRIFCNTGVETIDIEAPNLSTLTVMNVYPIRAPRMNLGSCKKLTEVNYFWNQNLDSFTNFLSNFPFIETLVLNTNNKCNNLKLSSDSLKRLVLRTKCNLEDIEFRTPNLDLFVYTCKYHFWHIVMDKFMHLLWDLTCLKACMQCCLYGPIDALWFQKLRLFLDKKNGFKTLNLIIYTINCEELTDLEKLKAIELPPYELENVELKLDPCKNSSNLVALMEAVIWCCCPRSLTLRSSIPVTGFEDVVKFTCKKLLEQEDKRYTNIQILLSSSTKDPNGESVTLIKEEAVNSRGNKGHNNIQILSSSSGKTQKLFVDLKTYNVNGIT